MRAGLGTVVVLVAAVSCGGGVDVGGADLVVSAASSLTDVFSEIETEFERGHPGVDVILNIGGSSLLREQILGGAPVDVFASANPEVMDEVLDAGLVRGEAEIFARNRLEIAVPHDNPAGVDGLGDFDEDVLLIGLCAPEVPCGQFARQVLQAAGVDPKVDTEEPNVRALLSKLETGDLDAGIVYRSDILTSDGVEGIAIPDELNVSATYVIAGLISAGDQDVASEFVSFVLSASSRAIFADHGFELP